MSDEITIKEFLELPPKRFDLINKKLEQLYLDDKITRNEWIDLHRALVWDENGKIYSDVKRRKVENGKVIS